MTGHCRAVDWNDALIVGHTPGDRCFFEPGEEMVFTLTLEGVKGEIPAGDYFIAWERTANDGLTEHGSVPASLQTPLVIRTKLDRPGFVKIEANLVDKTGKRVPKDHLWEKRVFFQGGAGVAIEKLQAWPEPKDFDAHWAAEKALVDGLPLRVIERKPLPCPNPKLNLWQVKIPILDGYMPMTGYLAIPKDASATHRVKATGHLSGYYMWRETCPAWITNTVDGIQMYINRHGCEGDREEEYYKPFLKNPPYGPDHFRGMALRGMMMFRFLKSLPEWDGKTLESKGSSGGAMQSLWMAALVPGITSVDVGAPALGDVFGFQYGRATGDLAQRVEEMNYYDICNFAKRITVPVSLSQGLGDYTCPPFGAAIVYNNLKGPKSIVWRQGTTHGWWPGGMAVVKFSDQGGGSLQAKVGAEHLTAGQGGGDDVLRVKEDLAAAVAADVAKPVRPAGVNGQPFWNRNSWMFMYPPSFDFRRIPGATRYRYTLALVDDDSPALTMETASPNSTLEPVWMQLPTGLVQVHCEGVDAEGRACGEAGVRRFWKSAPFRPGAYPPAARPYAEAAAMACEHIYQMPNTQHLAKHGEPDPAYDLNCYPAKMNTGVINAMLDYAKRRPDHAEDALAVACAAADYLLRISQPASAPLAHFPPTYIGDKIKAKDYAGQNMLLYPAPVALVYLRLHEATGDSKYESAALAIGKTYLKLQGDDGTWPLKLYEKDGSPVVPNRAFPMNMIELFEALYKKTEDPVWRRAADRAFGYIEKGPLTTWNWDAQFEDVEPQAPYGSLTKHNACSTAIYLVNRFPGDRKRLAQARELLRFAEDQFVYWEKPCRPDGTGYRTGTPVPNDISSWLWDYTNWFVPGVGEQHGWDMPIDASAAKLIRTYLALYKATGDGLDLAKACALGDAMTNIQNADGSIRTHWLMRPDADGFWINCLGASVKALDLLADAVGEPRQTTQTTPSAARRTGVRRGVMLPARPCTEDDFRTLQEWGVTLVRYQMTEDFFRHGEMKGGYAAYERWLDDKLDHLMDFILPQARKRGMKVVVDLHVPPGGRAGDSMNWAIYSDPVALTRFFDCWRKIATRAKGNADVIYGYDLLNEPVHELPPTTLDYLATYEKAAKIVRAIDPETPVIVQSLDWAAPEAFAQLRPIDVDNVVYQVHLYRPQEFTHQGTSGDMKAEAVWPDAAKGWGRDYLRQKLAAVRDFEKKYDAKIYVGEFSASSFSTGADVYIADCIALFEEYGWDWTYHAFREWTGWSVEHEPVETDGKPAGFKPSADNPRKRALLRGLRGT